MTPNTRMKFENCIQCRHQLDKSKVDFLIKLLRELPKEIPQVMKARGIKPADYDLLFRSAIESIRGVYAATSEEKKRFLRAIFDRMKRSGDLKSWDFVGTKGRQDYRLALRNGRLVCIEAKGCPDGNNMTIWERPTWAEEFIVWSQCPDSLQHQPGHGIWSGIAIRLVPKMIVERRQVDAFVFYDGRCGSEHRRCPKSYGISGSLRLEATDVAGQDGRDWLPPPSIYLFPRTIPHPHTNKTPRLHDLKSCQFADRLLNSFDVPKEKRPEYLNWAKVAVKADSSGTHVKISLGIGSNHSRPAVEGDYKRLRRE